MVEISHEVRQAVAENECRRSGHDTRVVLDVVTDDPARLTCLRCGRAWPIGPGVGGAAPRNQPDAGPAAGTGFATPAPLRERYAGEPAETGDPTGTYEPPRPQPGLGDEDAGDYGRGR
jgi:hypothetical protein